MWKFFDKYGQARVQNYGGPAAGVIVRKITPKTVVNMITETDLLNGEFTIPANLITTGRLRLTASGDFLQNSGASTDIPRIRLKLGGTILIDTAVFSNGNILANSATRKGWKIEVDIVGITSASQWVDYDQRMAFMSGSASFTSVASAFAVGEGTNQVVLLTGGQGVSTHRGGNATTIDTTAARLLELNVINPVAHASMEVKLMQALAEIL